MFALLMALVTRLVEDCPRDNQVMYITQPALLCFYHAAVDANTGNRSNREYEPYNSNGTLRDLFYEKTLIPEE